ncbi:hypothetical protein VaNZ11_011489, partial [Volvox africanus]
EALGHQNAFVYKESPSLCLQSHLYTQLCVSVVPMLLERRPRVIIHVDLDAFYCQVEQKRHDIPREVPCAVQQWDGLIAVNYAARAAGVTRHMRVAEAKKVCPQLRTIHVETIGDGDNLSPGRTQQGGGRWAGGGAARRNEAKASLQPYRQASGEIMRLLSGLVGPGCLLEKASVDEAYLDVTPMVEEELRRLGPGAAVEAGPGRLGQQDVGGLFAAEHPEAWGYLPALEHDNDEDDGVGGGDTDDGVAGCGGSGCDGMTGAAKGDRGGSAGAGAGAGGGGVGGSLSAELLAEARRVCETSVVVGGPLDLLNDTDRRLLAGAIIALRMRQAVRSELDFTSSAGVATNKLLAKVGSARNKPDKQTIMLPRGVADLLRDMPLSKLRGLGGKLGASLEQHFGATNAGQVQQLPLEQLQRVLGERTGLWVSQVVRGQCSEPVTPKDKPKSLLSCKSFESTRDLGDLGRWLAILAEELAQRSREDEEAHRRRARTLVLHYRGIGPRERSVRCPMPQHGREGPSPAALAKAAMEMLRRQPDALPCSRLAIAATEFDDPPAAGARAITRFFSAQPQPSSSALQQPLPKRPPEQQVQQQQQQQQQHRGREHRVTHEHSWSKEHLPQLKQEEPRQQQQQNQERQQQSHAIGLSGYRVGGEDGEELTTWHGDDDEHTDMCVGGESGEEYNEPYDDAEMSTSYDFNDQAGMTNFLSAPASVQELGALPPQQVLQQLQNRRDVSTPQLAECQPFPRPCKRVRQGETGAYERGPLPSGRSQRTSQLPTLQQSKEFWGPQIPLSCRMGTGGEPTCRNKGFVVEAGAAELGPGRDDADRSSAQVEVRVDVTANGTAGHDDAEAAGAAGIAAAAAARPHDVGSAENLASASNGGDLGTYQCEAMSASRGAAGTCQGGGRPTGDRNPGTDLGPDLSPNSEPGAADLLSNVDLDEQRRILHDIELARLRSLGKSSGSGRGVASGLLEEAGGRGGGPGRRGGGGGVTGRGRGRVSATMAPAKGQMRLTALLWTRSQNGS